MTDNTKSTANTKSLVKEALKFCDNMKNLTENGIFSRLNTLLHTEIPEPKSLDEFADVYGSACDSIITNTTQREKLSYVSGILSIAMINETQFNCTAELYFKNPDNKWILKKATSDNFNCIERLLPDAIQELKKEKIIKHEITAP